MIFEDAILLVERRFSCKPKSINIPALLDLEKIRELLRVHEQDSLFVKFDLSSDLEVTFDDLPIDLATFFLSPRANNIDLEILSLTHEYKIKTQAAFKTFLDLGEPGDLRFPSTVALFFHEIQVSQKGKKDLTINWRNNSIFQAQLIS